jgi:thioredoxin-related protein
MKTLLATLLTALALQSALAEGGNWVTDLPAAKAQAKKENKLVLIDFTGSDWCPPCKKLTAEVLSKQEFLDFATKHFVLVEIDSPRNKPQSAELKATNEKLKTDFAIQGVPTLIVVKPDGKEVWRKVGYSSGGPQPIITELEGARKKS